MKKLTSLLIAVLLAACATIFDDGAGWNAVPTHAPLPPKIVPNNVVMPQDICGATHPGCSTRDYFYGVCWVYIPDHPSYVLKLHEFHHCEGYDHD